MFIDRLDYIAKIKPVNVESSTCIDSCKKINEKDPKLKINDIVIISKYQNIFAKVYSPNWPGEVICD